MLKYFRKMSDDEAKRMQKARESKEVKEARRIAKNVKIMLINRLKRHSQMIEKEVEKMQKIIHNLEDGSIEINRQIRELKNEINND